MKLKTKFGNNYEMTYEDDINRLLDKYSTKQPSERWSPQTKKNFDDIRGLSDKLVLFDGINGEYFRIRGTKKDRVKYLIKDLNFNKICPRCNSEQIIVLVCYYVNCEYNSYYTRDNCKKVFKAYNITDNLVDRFMLYMARRGIEGTNLDKKVFEAKMN